MNVIKRKELRAFQAGCSAAVKRYLPELEAKYRLRSSLNFWLALFVVASLAFAVGVAVGEAL